MAVAESDPRKRSVCVIRTTVVAFGYLCDRLCGRPKITSGESNLTLGASPLVLFNTIQPSSF